MEVMEQSFDKKINALGNSILAQVKSGVVAGNVASKLFERDLISLEFSLNNFQAMADPNLAQDLEALKTALANVKGKLHTRAEGQ